MEEAAKKNMEQTAAQAAEATKRGTLELAAPIRAAGQDIRELKYDFTKLTGWEYAQALDEDISAGSVFRLSNRQAISLFAAAAAKATAIRNEAGVEIHPLDAKDIRDRLGIEDGVKAAQLAAVFFIVTAREANKRTTAGS